MPPGDQERNPRRRSSMGPLIGAAVVVVIAVGGYFAWKALSGSSEPQEPSVQVETPVIPEKMTYASSTMRIAVQYPPEFNVQEQYAYTRVSPTKPISGVKFLVPASFTEGNNLAPDSGISIEQLPRANTCTGDIYLKANVRAQQATEGAVSYSLATSSETVGSDTFEEMVFAVPSSSPCVAVRYFLHSVAAGTSTTSYDRATVVSAFDEIRRSLVIQ